uniref:Uncharacterized protein n=1 Tax=Knipowitschia caucasica TaxID=637954 RepID=A0AAV2MEX1_KNICA
MGQRGSLIRLNDSSSNASSDKGGTAEWGICLCVTEPRTSPSIGHVVKLQLPLPHAVIRWRFGGGCVERCWRSWERRPGHLCSKDRRSWERRPRPFCSLLYTPGDQALLGEAACPGLF